MALETNTPQIGIAIERRRQAWPGLRVLTQLERRRKFAFWAGFVPIVILLICAVVPQLIAPYDPFAQNVNAIYKTPSFHHIFGTDNVGSDVFSKVVYGARVTVKIGVASALLGTVLALVIGIISGFAGGWLDTVVQRLVDAFMAFPGLILLLLIVAEFGQGQWSLIGAIALFLGIPPSRVIRSAVLSIREEAYVTAAKSIGASDAEILVRHVLPNVMPIAIVLVTVAVGNAILVEASLDFLGLGLPPPNASWGYSIGAIGRVAVLNAPWIGIFPGLALSATVFAFNVFGDGLRDVLDPRMNGSDGAVIRPGTAG